MIGALRLTRAASRCATVWTTTAMDNRRRRGLRGASQRCGCHRRVDRTSRGWPASTARTTARAYSGTKDLEFLFHRSSGTAHPSSPRRRHGDQQRNVCGRLLHNGAYFASAWEDARQDANYEVYSIVSIRRAKSSAGPARYERAELLASLRHGLQWRRVSHRLGTIRRSKSHHYDVRLSGQRIVSRTNRAGNVPLTSSGTLANTQRSRSDSGDRVFASQAQGTVHAKFLTRRPI